MLQLTSFLFIFLFTSTKSTCVEKIYSLGNVFASSDTRPSRSLHVLQEFLCVNITADLQLDAEYEVKPHRQELRITNSLIPKIPKNSSIAKFTHIKVLRVVNVSLEEVEPGAFDQLVQLEELNLSVNKLKKISHGVFNHLTLTSLSLALNAIGEIEEGSFTGLERLSTLYLFGNKMAAFRKNLFDNLTNLEYLWISENPLTEFGFSNFPRLKTIVAIRSDVKTLDLDFRDSPLELLKFTEGKLVSVDFEKLAAGKILQLNNNEISEAKNWDKIACKKIVLHHNKLTTFDISENVVQLLLHHNAIAAVGNTDLGKTKKLEELYLSYNKIAIIDAANFRGLTELGILELDHNDITILKQNTFSNSPYLRKLQLSHNKIATIETNAFRGLNVLDHLDLSGNPLKEIKSPVLSELRITNVVVGSTDIDWGYVGALVGNSEDLTLQLDSSAWNCSSYFKYFTKNNVNTTECHLYGM